MQPSATQAYALVESWLRGHQVQGAKEALVITGRGKNSIDGYSPVREAIIKLLPSLRRRNVISSYAEHTAGSFVVSFAPVGALFDVPKRRREKTVAVHVPPQALAALDEETLRLLHELAMFVSWCFRCSYAHRFNDRRRDDSPIWRAERGAAR